jgi:hypothetical protein
MNSDVLLAISGLIVLIVGAVTGALWDTPLVTVPFRWFVS